MAAASSARSATEGTFSITKNTGYTEFTSRKKSFSSRFRRSAASRCPAADQPWHGGQPSSPATGRPSAASRIIRPVTVRTSRSS